MHGLQILARTLSVAVPMGKEQKLWQYHPRSDRHSKVACWGILFDLMRACPLLREHIGASKLTFGINHEMRDFKQNRKKNLDLVLCSPAGTIRGTETFADLVDRYAIVLSPEEVRLLRELPEFASALPGTVYAALEAKACMTEHIKARPRLYDELNSSHQTVHGASEMVIAVGFVMINVAATFISPGRIGGIVSKHRQPEVSEQVVRKVTELPRRAAVAQEGFDAMAIVLVDCVNDGRTPVRIVSDPPSPHADEIFHYDMMIRRVAHTYESRFPRL